MAKASETISSLITVTFVNAIVLWMLKYPN